MWRMTPALMLILTAVAMAQDLGVQAPAKMPGPYHLNIPDPARQGGDDVAGAMVVPGIPYDDAGTTVGYTDDYQATCLVANGAPDIVYTLVVPGYPAGATGIDISLCGSAYDTGLYVLDAALAEVACNDDMCGYQSQIANVALASGQTYHLVVDGYGVASGRYEIAVTWHLPYELPCSPVICTEDEPALVTDYVDDWNGGCDSPPRYPFHPIHGALPGSSIPAGSMVMCGVSGWYQYQGVDRRDTDWFTMPVGPQGAIEVIAEAEYPTYIFELTGSCAGGVQIAQQSLADPAQAGYLTISGAAYATKWLWVGPATFSSPDGTATYDWVLWFDGLLPSTGSCHPVAVESVSWGAVKALYR